jgi:glycosyltransferase involved in cell wall biosynthesis
VRIAVCDIQVPLVRGGAELHSVGLVAALARRGHEAELISLPFRWYPAEELVNQMLAWRLIDVTEAAGRRIDRVIALRFPSYLVRHPCKVAWVVHQFRSAYELWNTEYGDLAELPDGRRVRQLVTHVDATALAESHAVFANSHTVAARLARFNGIAATPLYHPPALAARLHCADHGAYIFSPSRLEPNKRQALLIRAMLWVRADVTCVIAGTGTQARTLHDLVAAYGLERRVVLLGHVDDAELLRLYAHAGAAFFGPYDEDYGYVTLEAMLASKPVITLTDSGGPLEFVEHGVNGLVAAPEPMAIAEAIDTLFADRNLAVRLGAAGRESIAARRISWDAVVDALTA